MEPQPAASPPEVELVRVTVLPDEAALTVGRFLVGRLKLSSTLIRRLKVQGGIRLNGAIVRTNHPIAPGDELVLALAPNAAPGVYPQPIPVTIVYEDAALLVVNKPPGLVVHPTQGQTQATLANGIAALYRERGEAAGIHPVHRIDRNTSGLVLFAKNPLAHQRLDGELRAHKLERTYMAWVWGQPPDAGRIDEPIALVEGHPVARAVAEGGQAAITDYAVVERFDGPGACATGSALVAVKLATGRTHQIRVHLAHLGHPLVGDGLYGSERADGLDRQALHAATLAFYHPQTGAWCEFHAPLPADLAMALQGARAANGPSRSPGGAGA